MRKVFLIFLFFQAIFLASQSDLPEVYTVKIEDTGNDISFYLDQAVLEAIVRATGNRCCRTEVKIIRFKFFFIYRKKIKSSRLGKL